LTAWRNFESRNDKISSNIVDITAPVLLLADTQEHEIGGLPITLLSPAIDRENEVTIRPVYHSLYLRKLLEEIILKTNSKMIIHLGDAMDISCISEWNRLSNSIAMAMEKRRRFNQEIPFYLLPGNHDGFMAGTMNPNDFEAKGGFTGLLGSQGWQMACSDGTHNINEGSQNGKPRRFSGTIQKDIKNASKRYFITRDVALKKINDFNKIQKSSINNISYNGTYDSQIKTISAFSEDDSDCNLYSCSYLTQLIQLPPTNINTTRKAYLLAFDTNQSEIEVLAYKTANHESIGDWGNVYSDQINSAKALLSKIDDKDIVIFSGHHPWESLDSNTQDRLVELFKTRKHAIVYVSAHTHSGYWARHDLGDNLKMLELNISSLADWPIASKALKISASSDGRVIRISTLLYALETDKPLYPINNGLLQSTEGKNMTSNLKEAWDSQCSTYLTQDAKQRVKDLVENQRQYAPNVSGVIQAFLKLTEETNNLYRSKTPELCLAYHAHVDKNKLGFEKTKAIIDECAATAIPEKYKASDLARFSNMCKTDYKNYPECIDSATNSVNSESLIHRQINWLYSRKYYDIQEDISIADISPELACLAVYAAQVDAQLTNNIELLECNEENSISESCKVPNRLQNLGLGSNFYISEAISER
jgi:hypothetical protein